jgi:hypothetical protein
MNQIRIRTEYQIAETEEKYNPCIIVRQINEKTGEFLGEIYVNLNTIKLVSQTLLSMLDHPDTYRLMLK